MQFKVFYVFSMIQNVTNSMDTLREMFENNVKNEFEKKKLQTEPNQIK